MTYPLLGRIQAPGDVKRLQESELPCARKFVNF